MLGLSYSAYLLFCPLPTCFHSVRATGHSLASLQAEWLRQVPMVQWRPGTKAWVERAAGAMTLAWVTTEGENLEETLSTAGSTLLIQYRKQLCICLWMLPHTFDFHRDYLYPKGQRGLLLSPSALCIVIIQLNEYVHEELSNWEVQEIPIKTGW